MDLTNFDLQAMLDAIVAFLPRLGLALLVYLIAYWLSTWVARLMRNRLKGQDADEELIILLQMLTRWGIRALGIVLALEQLAPGRLSTLLAGLGIAGVTIGFALQDVAKNFIAGILLLLTQPFEIGDTINVSGFTGSVLAINLRSTELRETDGRYVIIPNSDVFVSPIVNFSRAPTRRIQLDFGLTIESDLELASRTMMNTVQTIDGVLDDPAPQLVLGTFSDSVVQASLFYWIDVARADYGKAQTAGAMLINAALKEAGVVLPYPTVEVTMVEP